MKSTLRLLGAATLLLTSLTAPLARADFLPNNFWPNSTFESGTNLDASDGSGTPTGWVRNGSDPTICQVTSAASTSPTHAILVNDQDTGNYGEWDAYVPLTGFVSAGDSLNVRYSQMFHIQDGEMRVAVVFQDANNNAISAGQFVVTGDSPGWNGTIASSTFTQTNVNLIVPIGAVTLNIGIVSGGSEVTSGYLVVDDLSVDRATVPELLAGNFWPNASFETGTNLDQTNGTPTGWSRGGSDPTICRVTTNNYVSASHALLLNHTGPDNYGAWVSDVTLPNTVTAGAALNVQWFELYSVTNGEMRLTISFIGSGGNFIQSTDFNTIVGNSAGWQGSISNSGFTKRNSLLVVPTGAVTMEAALVSGGPESTTGVMLLDDLSVALPPPPAVLPGNFWPNSTFESGVNLNQTNGVPTGWVRNGDDATICQVSTLNSTSPTHSLAIIDGSTTNYGEWDADLTLSTNTAAPGNLVDIQYSALYSITNGPMRLTALFFDANSNVLSATDFNVNGQSAGWQGTIASSTFAVQTQQVSVPATATRMRFALVSGGPELGTGVFLIDDLSAAVHVVPPVPATILVGNFFPNPTFEQGVSLDNPTIGIPSGGWNRGGGSALIDQMSTTNSTSPSHSLALVDTDPNNYGEWYMFFNLAGLVSDNDAVDVQYFQLYNITNGAMRLSFAFLDSGGNTLFGVDNNVTGLSTNWHGSLTNSPFQKQNCRYLVPVGTTQLRVNLASGGAASVVGTMLIDDLSVRLSKPQITSGNFQSNAFNLTFNSMPSKNYTISFTSALGASPVWTALATNVPGASGALTTSYSDTTTHPGKTGFYRIIQQ